MNYKNERYAFQLVLYLCTIVKHYANKKNSCRQYFLFFNDHVRFSFPATTELVIRKYGCFHGDH